MYEAKRGWPLGDNRLKAEGADLFAFVTHLYRKRDGEVALASLPASLFFPSSPILGVYFLYVVVYNMNT